MHCLLEARFAIAILRVVGVLLSLLSGPGTLRAAVTRDEVDRAIRDGIRYLKQVQKSDGSWADSNGDAHTGTTSLVTLALLNAGEKTDSPAVHRAVNYLRSFTPDQLNSTYAIALQTMVYAAAEPDQDMLRIAANVSWLETAQIKPGDAIPWPGSWSYSSSKRAQPGDNSNSQYALLGLARPAKWVWPLNPRSGRWRELTGSVARSAMEAGPTLPTPRPRQRA